MIQCPVDETKLTPTHDEEVKVDLCPKCRGVWFDNTELAELWNRQIKLHTGGKAKTIESNHFFMVDMLDMMYLSDAGSVATGATGLISRASGAAIERAGSLGGSAIESIPGLAGSIVEGTGRFAGMIFDSTPEVAGSILEATGEVSGAVLGGIGEIVGGLADI